MKKLVLLSAAVMAATAGFAQQRVAPGAELNLQPTQSMSFTETANKTTKDGDTVKGRLNFPSAQLDSLISYRYDVASPLDSGYVLGMNPYGDKGFAERFDISRGDSAVKVLGTFAIFDGRYQATSSKTVTISVWNQSNRVQLGTRRVYFDGYPGTTLATQSVSIRNLGIGVGTANDSIKYTAFTTPTAFFSDSFYVGYTANWTWAQSAGDTISLKSTRANYRYQPVLRYSGLDTFINVKNAVQFADNSWNDQAIQNAQLQHHFAVFPVFVIRIPAGVNHGVTKNNFTLYGNYPNPAADATNIRFALKNAAEVTITLTDMTGRTIRTISGGSMAAGENNIQITTSDLASGNYIYLIRTSEGDGMGAQLTVAK